MSNSIRIATDHECGYCEYVLVEGQDFEVNQEASDDWESFVCPKCGEDDNSIHFEWVGV